MTCLGSFVLNTSHYNRNDTDCAGLDFNFAFNECFFFDPVSICSNRQQILMDTIYNLKTNTSCGNYSYICFVIIVTHILVLAIFREPFISAGFSFSCRYYSYSVEPESAEPNLTYCFTIDSDRW